MEQYPDGLIYIMSWDQLLAWIDHDQRNPFGPEREDLRSAQTTAAIINCTRSIAAGMSGKRDFTTVSPMDFVLTPKPAKVSSQQDRAKEWKYFVANVESIAKARQKRKKHETVYKAT